MNPPVVGPPPARPLRPGIFLDRDGTLIEHVADLVDAAAVRLLPGVAEALIALRSAGRPCIVVTNQSVIGRGLLDEAGLTAIHAELDRQLADSGARVDAYYACPAVGELNDPTRVEHPDRKPGPGLLLRAAREHGLDLAASWMIGDSVRDVLAGRNAGCRGSIRVRTGVALHPAPPGVRPAFECRDLREAVELLLACG